MTERQPDEAILDIAGHGEFLMQRTNTRLYCYLGSLSTRNHIFIALEEQEHATRGAYVFAHSESYDSIYGFVVANEYPMSLNNLEVDENDELAFQRSLDQLDGETLDDYIPDDWK